MALTDEEEIAAGLSEQAREALLQSEPYQHTFRICRPGRSRRALHDRGLIYTFPEKIGRWETRSFKLTQTGIAVRDHLASK